MKISEHAKQRFVERMRDKDPQEAKRFAAMNSEMITEHFTKLFEHATCIYKGASFADSNNKCNVLIKDTWIIIYDEHKDTIVTVYSIDLGIGKEFNDQYINNLLAKINELNAKREAEIKGKEELLEEYHYYITEEQHSINEYRKCIKNCEQKIEYYKGLEQCVQKEIDDAGQELRDLVGMLIKKKVF